MVIKINLILGTTAILMLSVCAYTGLLERIQPKRLLNLMNLYVSRPQLYG